jgi:hypothetical protein
MNDNLYFIASLKHTNKHHEHITFWGRVERGYTPVLGANAGKYVFGYAVDLNDGLDCLAVPVSVVKQLLSPEPYFRPDAPQRFYDQRGPVVDNTRANWNRMIAMSLPRTHIVKPKPEVFRGTRRSSPTSPLRHEGAPDA